MSIDNITTALRTAYRRPAVPVVFALASGILVGSRYPGGMLPALFVSLMSGMMAVTALFRKTRPIFSPLACVAAAGYLLITPWIAPDFPAHHVTRFIDCGKVNITGTLIEPAVQKGYRLQFYLRADTIESRGRRHSVAGNLKVTVAGPRPRVACGDRVTFLSRIRAIHNFSNPGGFDYKRYMAFRDIHATAYASGVTLHVISPRPERGIKTVIAGFRSDISRLIDASLPEARRHVLKALLIGKKSDIPKTLRQAFSRAGAAHLLAISGLHIGIVASISFVLFKWCCSRLPVLLWNAWAVKCAALFAVGPVMLYGAVSGMSPSTQRAVVMVVVFLMTFLFEKKQDIFNTLAVAALVILFVSPPSLFSVSFQLSFAAVFFIVYGSSKLIKRHGSHHTLLTQLIRKLALFSAASLFAILGTLPLVAYYFNQISCAGLFSNLLLIPLVGFIVVPVGLLSMAFFPFNAAAAEFGMRFCGFFLAKAIALVHFIADIPFTAFKTVTPTVFEMICFYALLLCMMNVKRPVSKMIGSRPFVAAVIILAMLAVDIGYWCRQRFFRPDLGVTILDVGQGSSALVEFPGSYRMLIDGGGFSDNTRFDVGQNIVAPFLWQKKIRTVDTLVLSHPNCDHLNGLIYIATHFHVRQVWTNNEPSDSKAYRHLMQVIRDNGLHMPAFETLPRSSRINGVTIGILYPPDFFLKKKLAQPWRDANNNSMVVRLSIGATSILLPGDIMAEGERELSWMWGAHLNSSILIAPHHGSRTSSTARFLDLVDPEIVIISSGWKNRYAMPHEVVLDRYARLGCSVFRTDQNGAISIRADSDTLDVMPTVGF